jgi:hypothetical protein
MYNKNLDRLSVSIYVVISSHTLLYTILVYTIVFCCNIHSTDLTMLYIKQSNIKIISIYAATVYTMNSSSTGWVSISRTDFEMSLCVYEWKFCRKF